MRISDWSSDVCSSDLALLLAYAGFTPLHWGLFALLAAAEQWLAWRERSLAVVPTTSLALSILLLALWPDALASWFAVVGIALAAIHELPLLARLWTPPHPRRTLELCLLALAIPALTKWQMVALSDRSEEHTSELQSLMGI